MFLLFKHFACVLAAISYGPLAFTQSSLFFLFSDHKMSFFFTEGRSSKKESWRRKGERLSRSPSQPLVVFWQGLNEPRSFTLLRNEYSPVLLLLLLSRGSDFREKENKKWKVSAKKTLVPNRENGWKKTYVRQSVCYAEGFCHQGVPNVSLAEAKTRKLCAVATEALISDGWPAKVANLTCHYSLPVSAEWGR